MAQTQPTDEARRSGEPGRAAPSARIPLTRAGVEEKQARLHTLTTEGRQHVADYLHAIQEARDALESGAHEDVKQAQALLEGEIRELQHILAHAVILDAPAYADDHRRIIQLGSVVEMDTPRGRKTFTIVSTVEADTVGGKISDESPVGRALIGHAEGEHVEIMTANCAVRYTVRLIHHDASPDASPLAIPSAGSAPQASAP